MPVLEKIVVQDFRNIELQELEFCPNVNCISGGNGQGKTNLLEAVWYLSMTKSPFGASDRFSCRHGCNSFSISGLYNMENGLHSRFSIQVADGEKKVRRDDKPCPRVSDHIGILPVVMVSPSDGTMVSDGGEDRRRFVNSVLSQTDRGYLSDAQQYTRLLLQRNRLLRDGVRDEDLLATYDLRLEQYATPIHEKRKAFVKDLTPMVGRYYEEISGGRESVGIEYRSELHHASLQDILKQKREQDAALRYTTAGVQRDDFIFTMDGHPIRRCGSQGQQKSFLVALKFAQYELMRRYCGSAPVLLLDDLFDKLDPERVGNLLQMVSGSDFGQIFITDSNKNRVNSIVSSITTERSCFEARGGVFSKE